MFIDDRENNLADVPRWVKSKNIDFVGMHYREANKASSKFPFSKERIWVQLDTVMEKSRWLSGKVTKSKALKEVTSLCYGKTC
ncbi:MAG: DUF2608 domain-containing protein [Puniceicoccales bacterium]|nr:DUF2608 domain-containing protein [Puniceicoccales bacterium]